MQDFRINGRIEDFGLGVFIGFTVWIYRSVRAQCSFRGDTTFCLGMLGKLAWILTGAYRGTVKV